MGGAMTTGLLGIASEIIQLLAAIAALALIIVQVMIKWLEYRRLSEEEK